jgi:antitoxin component YwqK of YwqJK toxin-antitoxin module
MKFENGNVKRKFYTDQKENIQDTMWDYYKTGEISKVRLFKDNKQLGKSFYYLKEGPLYEVQNYVDGKLEGIDSVFFPSGKIKVIANFKDGMRNGSFLVYREDGSIEKEFSYRNDTLQVSKDSLEMFNKNLLEKNSEGLNQ